MRIRYLVLVGCNCDDRRCRLGSLVNQFSARNKRDAVRIANYFLASGCERVIIEDQRLPKEPNERVE